MPASKTYSNLKDVTYRLITSNEELETALCSLKQSPILGLDCETTGLDPHIHTIRLIQLAVPDQPVMLIDLPQIAPCDRHPLFLSPRHFVRVGVDFDFSVGNTHFIQQ